MRWTPACCPHIDLLGARMQCRGVAAGLVPHGLLFGRRWSGRLQLPANDAGGEMGMYTQRFVASWCLAALLATSAALAQDEDDWTDSADDVAFEATDDDAANGSDEAADDSAAIESGSDEAMNEVDDVFDSDPDADTAAEPEGARVTEATGQAAVSSEADVREASAASAQPQPSGQAGQSPCGPIPEGLTEADVYCYAPEAGYDLHNLGAPEWINKKEIREKRGNHCIYQSTVSSYRYDPGAGDPDSGIAPGTPFESLPDTWIDPIAGSSKADFEQRCDLD